MPICEGMRLAPLALQLRILEIPSAELGGEGWKWQDQFGVPAAEKPKSGGSKWLLKTLAQQN